MKKYISIIWNNEVTKPRQLLIATDGIDIRVYRPNFLQLKLFEEQEDIKNTPDRVRLESISQMNLERVKPNDAYIWLDRYFLSEELQQPTTDNFLNTFGKDRPVYHQAIGILKGKWTEVCDDPHIQVMYDEWESYLEIVYGSRIGGLDLFLRHTYLANLSKLMATIFYSNGAFPSPNDTLKTS
ncbi:MAG: hypothetical protein JRJ69_12550 [Deltaproteobacteria bacterium]|nr:hypothetical protein [Deltaproteobacteria bacterium]